MAKKRNISVPEFVALLALVMSMIALSIDAMLPALGEIATSLGVTDENRSQHIVSTIFLGMSFGVLFFGPFSDSFGRKKAIYLGVGFFLLGSVISLLAQEYEQMLFGRILQGFGGSSCRIVSLAMIRDRFSGNEMARITSLIMMIFVLVPALAPVIGQLILSLAHWRWIFVLFIAIGLLIIVWMYLRQEETLSMSNRREFSFKIIFEGARETIKHHLSLSYTVMAGLSFGAFIGYLSSSRQILQVQYGLGEWFPLSFAVLALAIGCSSFLNSRLVMKFSMLRLVIFAQAYILSISGTLLFFLNVGFEPNIYQLMLALIMIFFGIGVLIGNLNAMAVEPLGHIAGIANSVIASIQTFVSVCIGAYIGSRYDGTVLPLISGFFLCSLPSLAVLLLISRPLHQVQQKEI